MSTVGLVDKLEVFASNPNAPHLALSLHATTDEVRARQQTLTPLRVLMPLTAWALARGFAAQPPHNQGAHALHSSSLCCPRHVVRMRFAAVTNTQVRDWITPVNRRFKLAALVDLLRRHYATGNSQGRRVLVEYTMLQGVNDSLEDAHRLLTLLEGVEAKVGAICVFVDMCLRVHAPQLCLCQCWIHALRCCWCLVLSIELRGCLDRIWLRPFPNNTPSTTRTLPLLLPNAHRSTLFVSIHLLGPASSPPPWMLCWPSAAC